MNRLVAFITTSALLFPLVWHSNLCNQDERGLYRTPFRLNHLTTGYTRDGRIPDRDNIRKNLHIQRMACRVRSFGVTRRAFR